MRIFELRFRNEIFQKEIFQKEIFEMRFFWKEPDSLIIILPNFQKNDRFTNRNFMDLESNNIWINWTNDVLSKINQNHKPHENAKKVMGE